MIQVIGYGNPGRGDDGLGPAFAARIADLPGVTTSDDYQLTVDHALQITSADRVVFVDALLRSDAPFEFSEVTASADHNVTSHSLSPQAVLALCTMLYGKTPRAFVLGITGQEFGEVREGLSQTAQCNLSSAETFLRDWLGQNIPIKTVGGLTHA